MFLSCAWPGQLAAVGRSRQDGVGMIAVEIDSRHTLFQRITEIIDDQRQNRALIRRGAGGEQREQEQPESQHRVFVLAVVDGAEYIQTLEQIERFIQLEVGLRQLFAVAFLHLTVAIAVGVAEAPLEIALGVGFACFFVLL